MEFCATCSMPLENETSIALHSEDGSFCIYCVDDDKKVKSCEDIFEGGVQYFMTEENKTRDFAEKATRKNMSMLAYWKKSQFACLQGDMLTDEEFQNLFKE